MELATSFDVNRPVSDVFGYVADLERAPEWAAAVLERTKLTDGPVGVGTRYRAVDQFPGRKVEFTVEITEYEPNRRIAATFDQPMEGGWDATFEPLDGGTRLTINVEGNPSGGLMKIIFPLMEGWAKRAIQRDLDRFKTRLERGEA